VASGDVAYANVADDLAYVVDLSGFDTWHFLWTNGMVPHGPDMDWHVAPLRGIKFWLESTGVEPTTSRASGNVLVQVRLLTHLPYVSPYTIVYLFNCTNVWLGGEKGWELAPALDYISHCI
jgi:hypothetical protein